jgi:hypothetical protein
MPKPKEPTAAIAEKKPSKSAKNIPVIELDGDAVKRFNEAKDQIAAAQKVIDALTPVLQEAGIKAVFKHNIREKADVTLHISSVRLQDKREQPVIEGETVETIMFSWTKTAKKCDSKRVEDFFDGLKTLDNKPAQRCDYAAWILGADFNTEVFYDPASKKFDPERYGKFVKALDRVSKQLKVENPLSTHKVMGPTANFHVKRFVDFALETNLDLAEVLPTTLKLEPVRPDKEEGSD